jgi:hypothetical protein
MSNRKIKNILDLKIDEMLSRVPVKPAKILNPFSSRSSSFLNLALLDSFNKIPAKPLGN